MLAPDHLDLRAAAQAHRPALPPFPAELLPAARATWRGRMVNEHGSAQVFEVLAEQLAAAGLHAEEVARCAAFATEERHHGVLCGAVVEALGGEARAEVGPLETVPRHPAVGAVEAATRNLLSICCLSETVAVALIGAERLELPEGELHALLTRIYADECGHANFGWRLLPELLSRGDADLPARLGAWLEVAFAHLVAHELSHLPEDVVPHPEGAAIGLCSGPDARRLFFDTVEAVIVPALDPQGLPAPAAWSRVGLAP